jgi:hypothetical protein
MSYHKQARQSAARDDFLFVNKDGRPLRARGIQPMLLRLGKKAGLSKRLSPHKLRHTFAMLSLKYGGNLEYIRKMLGHADIKATSDVYLNVQDADVRAAHQRFSPISNIQSKDRVEKPQPPRDQRTSILTRHPEIRRPLQYDEGPHEQQVRLQRHCYRLLHIVASPVYRDLNYLWAL